MDLTFGGLVALVQLTFRDPRQAAAVVKGLRVSDGARWMALVLMAVASAIVMHLVSSMAPPVGPDGEVIALPGPFFWAGMVGFGMCLTAVLAYGVGRWRGGRGTLPEAALLVAWLQVIQLVLVVLQLLIAVILPPLSGLLDVLSVVVFLWLLTNFVAELHGFRSVWKVLLGVVLTFAAAVVLLTLVLLPLMPTGV